MLEKIKSFLFENKTNKQTILKNTFWIGISELILKMCLIVLTILIGRLLGKEIFGIYSYYGIIITILVLLADMGLTQILIRDFENVDKTYRKSYFLNGLRVKIELSLAVFVVFLIFLFLFSQSQFETIIALFLLGITLLNSFIDYIRAVFRSLKLSQKELYIKSVQGFLLLFLVVFVLLFQNIYLILCAQMIAYFLTFFVSLKSIFNENYLPSNIQKLPMSRRELLQKGYAFSLSIILVQIYYYIDTIIIRAYLDFEQVGLYNAAYKIILFFILPMGIFVNSVFPVFSQTYKKNVIEFRNMVWYYTKIIIVVSFISFPIFYFIIPKILIFIFGIGYQSAGSVAQLLLISVFFLYINAMFTIALQANGNEKTLLWINLSAALGNAVLNIIFIPLWGIEGAAITTIITEMFLLLAVGYASFFSLKK